MDKKNAISLIEEALAKIPTLRNSTVFSPEHIEFVQSTGLELHRIFGPDSVVGKNFASINYQFSGTYIASYWNYEEEKARHDHESYIRGLNLAEGILRSAVEQLRKHGADQILSQSKIRAGGARVFISHGTQSPSLSKVERFIRALGLEPVIVVREASEGLSVDDLVEKRLGECDCVLILATADEEINGRKQPRPNVIHEIGLAQEKFGKKVIYLKEDGCEFPSNVRPKVWENFTQENMEAAFEKISRELHAFGLI
jgi:hypothetical protein